MNHRQNSLPDFKNPPPPPPLKPVTVTTSIELDPLQQLHQECPLDMVANDMVHIMAELAGRMIDQTDPLECHRIHALIKTTARLQEFFASVSPRIDMIPIPEFPADRIR
jgi:hypothetical protein